MRPNQTHAGESPSTRREGPPPWFDPGWLIQRTLEWMAAPPTGDAPAPTPSEAEASAEDALVAWLLRLPDSQDPAEAARELLDAYAPALAAGDPLATRLSGRLREVAAYPRTRLAHLHRPRRRKPPTRLS